MQRYMAQVKEEVNREIRFEELNNLQQEIKQTLEQDTAALEGSIQKASNDSQLMMNENSMSNSKKRTRSSESTVKPKVVKSGVSKPKLIQTAKNKVTKPLASKPKLSKPVK
jgi:sec-independent protein translocase protein TatB